ncbi:MAG: hypothetical protein ACRESZ_05060 [Methylococcales bacterium]
MWFVIKQQAKYVNPVFAAIRFQAAKTGVSVAVSEKTVSRRFPRRGM